MAITSNQASLIVQGQDRTGIVAAVASVLTSYGANIVSLDQYSDDPHGGAFFQRAVFSAGDLKVILPEIEKELVKQTEKGFELQFRLRADVERLVLARAVQWHSEDRVIRDGNHTIVFA
jgi:formyltetrahydrofolate deformylase